MRHILLALALTASACGAPPPASEERKPAPALVLEKVDGSGAFSLASQKGKVVLVDLWATWCGPCIAELPRLQKLSESFSPDEFQMVGVVLESGEPAEVRDFVREKGISYTNVLGKDETKDAFGPFIGYPMKYLVDKDGYVVEKYLGAVGTRVDEDVRTLVRTGALPKKTASEGGN